MTYLKLEFYKLKRRRVFLTTTIILPVSYTHLDVYKRQALC